jgi:hypothetical protein
MGVECRIGALGCRAGNVRIRGEDNWTHSRIRYPAPLHERAFASRDGTPVLLKRLSRCGIGLADLLSPERIQLFLGVNT